MAHKTFISYKYSEAQALRNAIIEKLGDDATYYQGETSDTPDLTDTSTDNIKNKLKDMMYDTSVTIVIISPNIKQSKWIDWELEYCLKQISREDRTSRTNGIVGVIQKVWGNYNWFKRNVQGSDYHIFSTYSNHLVYDIINNNRFNQKPPQYICNYCKIIDESTGNYISYVEEDEFLLDCSKYIDIAYNKSHNIEGYNIVKQK